uniref:Uncharacterized protein n=1 Tax=Ciona savignyi TaxID=51511 RepID=H2YR17_CIOSA
MGSKMSCFTCSSRERKIRRTLKRSGRSSSRRCRFNESHYEAMAQPHFRLERIQSERLHNTDARRQHRVETFREFQLHHQVSSNEMTQCPTHPEPHVSSEHHPCHPTLPSTTLHPGSVSKNIGCSIEILECPEMSTISLRSHHSARELCSRRCSVE